MSQKYNDFMSELEKLCDKHKIIISSSGYDSIEIWDMKDGDSFIHQMAVNDMTSDEISFEKK